MIPWSRFARASLGPRRHQQPGTFSSPLQVLLSLPKSTSPVISGAAAATCNETILRIEQIPVCAGIDPVDHSGLQIDQDRAGNVVLVVGLVEEDVLSIVDGRQRILSEVLEDAVGGDAMFGAELLSW